MTAGGRTCVMMRPRFIRLAQSTFGVNWYLADQLRVMFNYSYAMPEEPNTGMSAANLFAMRVGLFW